MYVGDVADAVLAGLQGAEAPGRTYELGGPKVWTLRELLAWVLKETGRQRWMMEIPMGLARMQAGVMEHLPGKPLTRDQLLMLERDNVVAPDAPSLEALGIRPTPVELIVPEYLRRFRRGGGRQSDYTT